MSVFARRLTGGGIVAAVVLGGLMVASTVVGAQQEVKYRGQFSSYMSAEALGYDDISGQAKMKVGASSTKVSLELFGLTEGVTYGSHLHNGTCASGGGGHYQDEEGGAVDQINELWLSSPGRSLGILVEDAVGMTTASGLTRWVARTDANPTEDEILAGAPSTNALSVVVHAPGGARIACADLVAARVPSGIAGK